MIYDMLAQIGRYRGLHPRLDRAMDFIAKTDLSRLPLGKTEVDGDDVFVNHFGYDTCAQRADALFEDHTVYLDLHIVLDGRENVLLAPAQSLSLARCCEGEDACLYTGSEAARLPLCPGLFLLVYPGEAHLPKQAIDQPVRVDKLVFKIRL